MQKMAFQELSVLVFTWKETLVSDNGNVAISDSVSELTAALSYKLPFTTLDADHKSQLSARPTGGNASSFFSYRYTIWKHLNPNLSVDHKK